MGALHRLKAKQVEHAEPGMHCDGGGLWLRQRQDGGQWILRFSLYGNRHEMGLGSKSTVSLAEARQEADKWRSVVRQNKNPIKERDKLRREAARSDTTFSAIAHAAFEAKKAELKGDGTAGRWMSPLEHHVFPRLGKIPVQELDQHDVKSALAPIWHKKAETARKAMNRIGLVLTHAAALDLDVDLQTTVKAKALLGKQRHTVKHIPAMPWQEVPNFYSSLDEGSVTHLALRLLILTTVRTFAIRHCHLDELYGDTWEIPADKMKSGVAFRVPLSEEAQSVLEEARKFERDGFLFPSVRKGIISDATMARLMERREMEARPHGFRSSFRDWCAEATDAPREVAEYTLAHTVGNKVERAYRRTDYFEARRSLLERWAGHVAGSGSDIVRLVAQ